MSKSWYVDLATLSPEHPLRNAPLHTIAARKRWLKPDDYPRSYWNGWTINDDPDVGSWKYIEPTWRIANLCFNDLGTAWTSHWQWQGKLPLAAPASAEYPSRS